MTTLSKKQSLKAPHILPHINGQVQPCFLKRIRVCCSLSVDRIERTTFHSCSHTILTMCTLENDHKRNKDNSQTLNSRLRRKFTVSLYLGVNTRRDGPQLLVIFGLVSVQSRQKLIDYDFVC